MNLDDESFLSAYLDDELDPADRQAVEWAVESSPPLSDRLRGLASARDAVAGLDRPLPSRDLAFSVVANLATRRQTSRLAALARSGRIVAAFAGVGTLAASLFIALTLLHLATHDDGNARNLLAIFRHPTPAPGPDRTHSVSDPEPIPTAPFLVAKNAPDSRPGPAPAILKPSPRALPPTPVSLATEKAKEAEGRRAVAGMIAQPRVIRAMIITDVIDAPERVRWLIETDPRKTPDFGRITIAQGIVVDPGRPDEAEVYPVVLDERGCKSFIDRLRVEFPDLRVQSEVGSELLAQLPEIGQVAIFRGTGAAELGAPPADIQPFIANKDAMAGVAEALDLPPILKGRPRVAQVGSNAAHALLDDGPIRDPRRELDAPVTVIVWVTRPPRR